MAVSDFTIIELNTIDSTNNYAMHLIDANKAQHGLTITALTQTEGKGQRSNKWVDKPGESLLMSMIVIPKYAISAQFSFNATVAVAIAKVLQKLHDSWRVQIKWPNDIIINDKKAGGILIENVLRGSKWDYSVIGIGINVRQQLFSKDLPNAISLKMASGKTFETNDVRDKICTGMITGIDAALSLPAIEEYNLLLYKKGEKQKFRDFSGFWEARIINVNSDGTLAVQKEDGSITVYRHGHAEWVWG